MYDANQENTHKQQYADKISPQAMLGKAAGGSYYRPSPAEEADKAAQYHAEEATKKQMASEFFKKNPAFSEFIQLIHNGSIGI